MVTDDTSVTVRRAAEDDLPAIADFFKRHDYGPQEVDWLQWKYARNPDGAASMFLAEDSEKNILGFQALIPRRYTSEKTGVFVLRQMVDVFIASGARVIPY